VDNPLKGLVPYAGDVRGRFPHSLEFNYLPLATIVVGEDPYDWSALDAYEAAFRVTPVLVRYPAGPSHAEQTSNVGRRSGYHDDRFAWATLDTGKKQDSWFFVPALKAAGPETLNRWQTQPIGGEIRPEAWGKVFAEDPGDPRIQDLHP
jgi:hypothetical protein